MHEVAELGGDEAADVLLRLLGRAADVRGEDDVGQPAQLGDELVAAALGLDREDVDGGAGDVPGLDVRAQRGVVDHEPAGEVEEQRARPHGREVGLAEEALVGRRGRRRAG